MEFRYCYVLATTAVSESSHVGHVEGRLRSTPLHAKKILQDSAEHALLRLADAQNSAEVLTSAVLFLGTSIEGMASHLPIVDASWKLCWLQKDCKA